MGRDNSVVGDLRTVEARKTDVLGALEAQRDVWLATADTSGRPHLIAVSAWWDGSDLVVATRSDSRTAANLPLGSEVRLAAGGPPRGVMIDAPGGGNVAAGAGGRVAGGVAVAGGRGPAQGGGG